MCVYVYNNKLQIRVTDVKECNNFMCFCMKASLGCDWIGRTALVVGLGRETATLTYRRLNGNTCRPAVLRSRMCRQKCAPAPRWRGSSSCRRAVQSMYFRSKKAHKFRSCYCEQRRNWQHRCIAEISANWLSNRRSSECTPSGWDGIKPARARDLRGTVEHHARYRELIRTINPSRRD